MPRMEAMQMEHDIKIWPEYFDPVATGVKRFELRKDDRGYAVGDILKQREWDPNTEKYSGRWLRAKVLYIVHSGEWMEALGDGFCVMSIQVLVVNP